MGFDNAPESELVYPKLSTVNQPTEQIGREAVRVLLRVGFFLLNSTDCN